MVATAATGTTYAFFTSSQTFVGNIISMGSFNFFGIMTDVNGLAMPSLIENNFAPGMTSVRCIFIRNTGSMPGRYKLYRGTDSGDVATLGNALQVTGTLNPTTGACSTLVPGNFTTFTKYPATPTTSTVSMTDPAFKTIASTPFKLPKTVNPVPPEQYVFYRLEISLPASVTSGSGLSYTTNLEVFGMQAEGSGTDTDW